MPSSESVLFQADHNQAWGTLIKLVIGGGYLVEMTDESTRQIVYRAKSGTWWAGEHVVRVSVAGVGPNESMVTVLIEEPGGSSPDNHYVALRNFIFDGLGKTFPRAQNQPQAVKA